MNKPKGIKDSVWEQHKQWAAVMREGSLTGATPKRDERSISKK